jgi:hypothetical protein
VTYRFWFQGSTGAKAPVLHTKLRNKLLIGLGVLSLLVAGQVCAAGGDVPEGQNSTPTAIINNYLRATQNQLSSPANGPVELEINASVPKLKKEGQLRVLRQISKVGQVTYRVLGFQGDNTVKNQVIARYLQAEQRGKENEDLAVTPANYKFKYRGERDILAKRVYVFQLSPRHKKVGLFKGELWLDAGSYLPVYEKGRLVKNPSIFFKKVDFERAFAIQNGVPVPAHMTSTIQTRIVGKVELDVNYTSPVSEASFGAPSSAGETSSAALTSLN